VNSKCCLSVKIVPNSGINASVGMLCSVSKLWIPLLVDEGCIYVDFDGEKEILFVKI
jgi:hypothetical protein